MYRPLTVANLHEDASTMKNLSQIKHSVYTHKSFPVSPTPLKKVAFPCASL